MTQTETFGSEIDAMVRAWWLLKKGHTVSVIEYLSNGDPGEHSQWKLDWDINNGQERAAYICSGCGVTVPVGGTHNCLPDAFRELKLCSGSCGCAGAQIASHCGFIPDCFRCREYRLTPTAVGE